MTKLISNEEIMKEFELIENIKLLKKTNSTVDKIITSEQNKIINKLAFLVYNQSKSYRNFENYSDLVQEGFVGLTKAVRRFDYTRFPNFFVFASQWISHYIKRAASRFDIVYNPNKVRVVYLDDYEEEDLDQDLDNMVFEKEKQKHIHNYVHNLSSRERNIICDAFGLNGSVKTLRKMGSEVGLTHERIRQIKNNVISKLKRNKNLNKIVNGDL